MSERLCPVRGVRRYPWPPARKWQALPSLRLGCGLRAFGHRWNEAQSIVDKQREHLDRDGEVALQSLDLSRQPIEPTRERGLATIGIIGGQERCMAASTTSDFDLVF
jgi:hypothetical protein